MKYQNFAIIFVVILLPISMVLSYYIQNQTDTLVLQTTYRTKLNDSTYDAIAAYQMNTLNTQRISGESVKSYVLASVNTFFTTLAANMGMSSAAKSRFMSYVPAILFTTYDGYYIYSPTKVAEVAINPNDGNAILTNEGSIVYISEDAPINFKAQESDLSTLTNDRNVTGNYTLNPDDAKLEYSYLLKPFIYYSAEYKETGKYDFVASYTLDNYVTLYGTREYTAKTDSSTLNGITRDFSKSGYLIDPDKITLTGEVLIKTVTRKNGESDAEPGSYEDIAASNASADSLSKNNVKYQKIDINNSNAYNYINYYYFNEDDSVQTYTNNGVTSYASRKKDGKNIRYQTGDEIIESTLDIEELLNVDNAKYSYLIEGGTYAPITVTYNGQLIEDREAKEYYIKAYFFSKWVQNNLSEVTAGSVNLRKDNQESNTFAYVSFENDDSKIFNIQSISENNPESEDSIFVDHKRNIIKNSIQYNLNTAISTYNANHGIAIEAQSVPYAYQLPVLSGADWDSILNNVTMVSFMQGIPCGNTTFNNYAVVKSDENNTEVSVDNLYFTANMDDSNSNYHKIDCAELNTPNSVYDSDLSAEFKYDAKKLNSKIDNNDNIICFYDDSTNTYYEVVEQDGEKSVGAAVSAAEAATRMWQASPGVYRSWIDATNGSELRYLYDHKNLGCYDCIISGIYTPAVKYYYGQLRRTYVEENGSLLIDISSNDDGTYLVYENGTKYEKTLSLDNSSFQISKEELNKRRKSLYTALGKYRNGIYKTNDYVNR